MIQRQLPLLALALSAIAAPSPVFAQPPTDAAADAGKTEASERFRKGVDLYRNGDSRAALVEFQRAYEVAPNYRVLFNIGQASFALKEYVAARDAFEGYLAQGGDEISEDRRNQVDAELTKLRGYVATIALAVTPVGAEIAVDDVVVGTSPLDKPLSVSAGRRKITITKPDHTPLNRFIDIAGGEQQTLELALVPVQVAAPAPVVAPTPAPSGKASPLEDEGMGTPFWIGLGLTGAFAAGAAITGGLAIGANSDYDAALDVVPTSQAAIDDARSGVKNLTAATDVLIGLGAASAIVTLVFAFTDDDAPSESAIRWQVDAGPGGLAVSAKF
jgi:tetratricopeptide (TPR) repeat protein